MAELELDPERVDEAVLGLHDDGRAWKGFDWAPMDRLHEKGFISDPSSKAGSVIITTEGLKQAETLAR